MDVRWKTLAAWAGIPLILAAACDPASVRLGTFEPPPPPGIIEETEELSPVDEIRPQPSKILPAYESFESYGYQCYPYRVWDFGVVNDGRVAFGLNDHGETVVRHENPEMGALKYMSSIHYRQQRIHRYFDCELRDAEAIGNLAALDINNSGQIVGWASDRSLHIPHAFYWNGQDMSIPLFDVTVESQATGINNAGLVVGYVQHPLVAYYDETLGEVVWWQNQQGFYWDETAAAPTLLENMPGAWEHASNIAHGVGADGTIVGEAQDENDLFKPISWTEQGGYAVYPTLGGDEGRVLAINDFGDMAGQSQDDQGELQSTFWSNDEVIEIPLLDGPLPFTTGRARAVNDALEVVGWDETDSFAGATHAWIWHEGVKQSLSDLVSPKLNLHIEKAYDINDKGEIAGIARRGGATRGVLLIPQSCDEFGGAR